MVEQSEPIRPGAAVMDARRVEDKVQAMLDWSNEAAAKVRETYPDPRTAFTAFYGRSVRERLAGLKDILPSLDMDDSTLSRSLYRSYATGMSDASLAHRVEGGLDLAASARLALEISEPTKFAYALGHSRVPPVYLTPQQVRKGLERVGIPCGMSWARWLIQKWDASSYLHRDGRLSLQDFERFFHSGVDRYVRSLERLAQEVTLEERGTLPTVVPERGRDGGATSAEPISRGLSVEEGRLRSRGSNVGIEERLPSRTSRNSEGGFRPRRVSVSAASQSVATMKRKGWDPKKHEAAMSRQQERVRGESAMVREDFDCELLLGRLREHVAFSRRIAESAEERRRAREEAGKGPIAVEMSVKQVGSQVPKVTLAIRDVSLQPMTPLASMLAMERCRGRPLTVSDFRYALVESGVEFTSTEVLQLASRFGYSPNTLGAPNAAASAALFDWRACMSAALGDGHDEIDRRAAAELASLCTAAHRWALSFSEPGSLSHEALCSVFPTHPAAEAGPHQGTPPFTGHPVLHGTTLLRLAARGDAERTRMLRMMQCLDRGHLGTLPLEDVVYTVVAFAPSSSGTPIARGDREALAATFPGPEIRGLAAKVLGQDRQCDFAALVRSLSPMRGDVEVDKARCGCRTWASPSTGELRDEGDPVAAMVRMSSVVFRDYLELGRALENLEAPDGTVSAADVAVAARSSLGLSLTGAEEAWLERHLGVDPASMGPGRRIPATRLMTAVYAVVDDLALRPVKLVMKVASDGRASVSFLVAGSPF